MSRQTAKQDLHDSISNVVRPFHGNSVASVGADWWLTGVDPDLDIDDVCALTKIDRQKIESWSTNPDHLFPSGNNGIWRAADINDWAHAEYCKRISLALSQHKANAPRRKAETMRGPTALYRHYSADGTLLYVGVSISAMQRLSEHRLHSEWFFNIAAVTLQWYPTRVLAEAAEIEAIQKERPTHNIIHARHSE